MYLMCYASACMRSATYGVAYTESLGKIPAPGVGGLKVTFGKSLPPDIALQVLSTGHVLRIVECSRYPGLCRRGGGGVISG